MAVVIAIDAGTTGVRAIAFDHGGRPSGSSYREFTQHFPQPGLGRARRRRDLGRRAGRRWPSWCADASDEPVAAIGITDQRETAVVWDRRTGRAAAPGHRVAGPPHRRRAATQLRDAGPPRRWSARTHRPGARPLLLGHQARVAPHRGRRRAPAPTSPSAPSTRWLLWNLTGRRRCTPPTSSNASRTLLFDIRALALVRRSCATCSACPLRVLPEVRPVERPLRRHRRRRGRRRRRHPDQRHRRRPAGGAVRPGLLRAGHDQEHLRHRLVRADERGPDLPRAGRGAAHHRRLDAPGGPTATERHALRARGRHLRHRRRRAVAARRARASSTEAAEIGPLAESVPDTEGVVVVPGLHRAGQPVVGSLRPRHHRSASPGAPAGPTWPGRWSRRWPSRPATWSRP